MNHKQLKPPFPTSYWVIPGLLLAGEFPGSIDKREEKEKLVSLVDCGIRRFINLMETDEVDHSGNLFTDYEPIISRITEGRSEPVDCLRFPIADLNVPKAGTMHNILAAIMESIDERRPVYVHCWGGVGRTGTVVGCYLIQNGLANRDNVLEVIAGLRKNDPKRHRVSPETPAQRKFVESWGEKDKNYPTPLSRYIGCLVGGAVGDALGAPVEFMKRQEILRLFGPGGITAYAPAYGASGTITDDTQMTLFTAEGLLRGEVRGLHRGITTYTGLVAASYERWLYTQDERNSSEKSAETYGSQSGWLLGHQALHNRRAPGNTCLAALKAMRGTDNPADNNSKGCGGVMRVAPVGLFHWSLKNYLSLDETFQLGKDLAALTHGHPTGYLTGGVMAVLIRALCDGLLFAEALSAAKELLCREKDHEETLCAIELAEELSTTDMLPANAISRIGQGWIAEEALAISIYCTIVARDFREAVVLAVNHDGDSDSTGAITGNLMGAMLGAQVIPWEWLKNLELRDVIIEIAVDLYFIRKWDIGEYSQNKELNKYIWRKYPGC